MDGDGVRVEGSGKSVRVGWDDVHVALVGRRVLVGPTVGYGLRELASDGRLLGEVIAHYARHPKARAELGHVTCPIGVPGIAGKQPAVVAPLAVAPLLQRQKNGAHWAPWRREIRPAIAACQPWCGRLPGFFLLRVCAPRSRLRFWPMASLRTTVPGSGGVALRMASVTTLLPMWHSFV